MPTASTISGIINQLGIYFGGPYDATRRFYSTPGAPIIPLVYTVRRGHPGNFNQADFSYGQTNAPVTGAVMFIQLGQENGIGVSMEQRIAVGGATSGIKKVAETVTLTCEVRTKSVYAEDCQDAVYAIAESIKERIRADRTCGSGGFELGGFQVAETSPWLEWRQSRVETNANVSRCSLMVLTEAHYYVQA